MICDDEHCRWQLRVATDTVAVKSLPPSQLHERSEPNITQHAVGGGGFVSFLSDDDIHHHS